MGELEFVEYEKPWARVKDYRGTVYGLWPDDLTHERPDSWERLEEDAMKSTCGYFGHVGGETCETCPGYAYSSPQGGRGCRYAHMADLVRRARALAGDA